MKGSFKHITFEQRKVILSMINSKHKLKEIGEALNLDPTSISKEVKRNRIPINSKVLTNKLCKKLDRYPYVCNVCSYRYSLCGFKKTYIKLRKPKIKLTKT